MSDRDPIVAAFAFALMFSDWASVQRAASNAPAAGSPAAIITIPGDQLPPPQTFGGKIERDAEGSKQFRANGADDSMPFLFTESSTRSR